MKNSMVLWKFVSYLKKKKIGELTTIKKKKPKIPHRTNLERRNIAPEQKNQLQESSIEKSEVMHWHKNNIKSEIWH